MDTEDSILEDFKFIKDASEFNYFLFKNTDLKIQPYKLAKILF
jgi:hypothetical protein